ncbi:MAG: AMP-binding protein [Treponema sp.]|nr:AMP-binding protein [Treponema sp.]
MKPIRQEVSWKFLDAYRGEIFNSEWPTLPQMFRISQMRYGERPCFVDFEGKDGAKQTYTYNEAWQKIETLAQWMMANGVKKGDHVAVSGKNSPEWAVVFFAAMLAGAIAIPLDYALHENEIENLLKTAKPKMLFVDEEKFQHFSSSKKSMKAFSLSPKEKESFVYNLKSEKKAIPFPEVSQEDTAAILFTSGTTGVPKGVMLSHKNLVSDCFIAQQNLILYPEDVFYNLLPIHHAYTMQAALICPLSSGCSIVFGKSMAVSRLLKELDEGKISVMLGVPLLYNKVYSGIKKGIAAKGKAAEILVNAIMGICYFIRKITGKNIGRHLLRSVLEAAHFSTMRVAICGGGPLAPSVFKAYNSLGIDFIQGYGLTETSPIVTLNPLEHFKIESIGMDFSPYEEIKILCPNEDGIGEIAVKGPMVMQGYYNMPEETAEMFTPDGFLKTGDLGWMDSEHYVMLSGRAKNLIVTEGGKNVYPEEIEDAFQLYYDVEQIMVRGYIANEATKSEQIEALIYPSDDLIKRLGVSRKEISGNLKIYDEIKIIVDKVNKTLQPYARISKITILNESLEMTTTRKIKRGDAGKLGEKKSEEKPAAKKIASKKSDAEKMPKNEEKIVIRKPAEEAAKIEEKVAIKSSATKNIASAKQNSAKISQEGGVEKKKTSKKEELAIKDSAKTSQKSAKTEKEIAIKTPAKKSDKKSTASAKTAATKTSSRKVSGKPSPTKKAAATKAKSTAGAKSASTKKIAEKNPARKKREKSQD